MQPLAPAPPHSAQREMQEHDDLRAQLAAVINTPANQQQAQAQAQAAQQQAQQQLQAQQQQQQQQQSHLPHLQPLQPMSQQQHIPHGYDNSPQNSGAQNIDPQIAGQAHAHHALDMMGSGSAGGGSDDDNNDGRKGAKRELSQSKRAAQNRAAQRAFRQRKEGYIKQLESKVRDLNTLEENFKLVQSENYALRDYILQLQRRLLESQNEYPQPPPLINAIMSSPHDPTMAKHTQMGGMGQQNTMPMTPTAVMGQGQQAIGQASMGQDQTRQMQDQLQGGNAMHDLQARAAAAVVDFKESVEKRRQEHEEYLQRNAFANQNQGGGSGGQGVGGGGGGQSGNGGEAKSEREREEELSRQLQSAAGDAQSMGEMGQM